MGYRMFFGVGTTVSADHHLKVTFPSNVEGQVDESPFGTSCLASSRLDYESILTMIDLLWPINNFHGLHSLTAHLQFTA